MGGQHTSPVRGMRDLLPAECALRDAAAERILAVYRSHGFQRIETPALERLELLAGSQGGENEKLIFKVLKRGEKLDLSRPGLTEDDLVDAGLRYDLTVPLARYYAEHQAELPSPFKAIQVGPVWRAERPQKGRYRQFTQMDIDILGDASLAAEVELILATTEALAAVGLSGVTVRLNDRRLLQALAESADIAPAAFGAVCVAIDKLDKVGWAGIERELAGGGIDQGHVRALRANLEACELQLEYGGESPSAVGEPRAFDALARIRRLVSALSGMSATRVRIDPTLARGMGYYTGPIFEVAVEGLPYSLAGGGRYDRMIGGLTGRDVPATGFSIGFERLVLLLQERGVSPAAAPRRVALVYGAEDDLASAMHEASRRRADGAIVSVIARRRKAGKQRADLERQGFDEIVELGTDGGRGTA
jgi:histidyl-tRNA synthetase